MLSQNGWPASTDMASIRIVPLTVAGVSFPNGVRDGDVYTVMTYLANEFHRTVEPLHDGWCWGYYYKRIEGSTSISNHASGTALDFNAPRHPMGSRDTFTSSQVRTIERILATLENCVRWGGHYSGRADEMHFEINADSTVVARVAAKLTGTTPDKPIPVHGWTHTMIDNLPTLRKGDRGEDVQTWQGVLNARGQSVKMDMVFGPITEAATKAVQRRYGAEAVDGIVGPETWTIGLRRRDLR